MGGGGEVRARERVVRGDRVSNLRLAYLKSTWVCAGNLKRCSLHQLQNKVRLSLIYVQHRCYPLCLLHTGTPLWEEWLLPTVLQSSSQCSLGHRGEGLQWSPPLGWAGGGGGGGKEKYVGEGEGWGGGGREGGREGRVKRVRRRGGGGFGGDRNMK